MSRRRSIIGSIILGIAGSITGTALSWRNEQAREHKTPLTFSEIVQLERSYGSPEFGPDEAFAKTLPPEADPAHQAAIQEHQRLGPLTRYLTRVNDLCMKIFESANHAHHQEGWAYHEAFADELAQRMDPEQKRFHYELPNFFRQLPAIIGDVQRELHPLAVARSSIHPITIELDRAWTEDHQDYYHTETYQVTVNSTDSQGRTTSHQETRTRRVYDYSIHQYWFHQANGTNAARLLEDVVRSGHQIRIPERFYLARIVQREGADAISSSHEHEEPFTGNELLDIVNTWYSGSTFNTHIGAAYGCWEALPHHARRVRASVVSARPNYWFRTHSQSDAGPQEYQEMERALSNGMALGKHTGSILDNVESVRITLPQLETDIGKYIHSVREGDQPQAQEHADAILDTTRTLYQGSFERGLDVSGFRWYVIALSLAGGMLLGAAPGALAGHALDRRRQRQY